MAAAYSELATIYHKAGSDGKSLVDAAYQSRFSAESTFQTGIVTSGHELFLAIPHELSTLAERILYEERSVSSLLERLPGIARASLLRNLITDEVVSSNEIEGVHSTRKQINDVLARVSANAQDPSTQRFKEMAKLYLQLIDGSQADPSTPEEIRSVYDTVMDGELSASEIPDGKLFRKGPVEIVGSGARAIHQGVNPEGTIIDYLNALLKLTESKEMPALYNAAIAHYVFEYIHPFYDGNGRTGRYLLALHLSRTLTIPTVLSLSRVIAENKGAYYRGFKSVENPLNRSEVTSFVLIILGFINQAQRRIIDRLKRSEAILARSKEVLKHYETQDSRTGTKECAILWQLIQVALFGAFEDTTIHEIAQHLECSPQTARKRTQVLEEEGLIEAISKRPLAFKLSEKTRSLFLQEVS